MKRKIEICYLCGQSLDTDISDDHIPPKQFYAKSIRKIHSPNLLTLPTHKSCNNSYQNDEDYFVHSLAPLAMDSYSGDAIWNDISNQFKRPEGKRIRKMIKREFAPRPSGIILPGGKVLKRFNGDRVWKIVWKITRGLFFKEKGKFLPEGIGRSYKIFSVCEETAPKEFVYVNRTPSRGQYPAVFDYKYREIPKLNNLNFWAMFFWVTIITLIVFHDPDCSCDICKGLINKQS